MSQAPPRPRRTPPRSPPRERFRGRDYSPDRQRGPPPPRREPDWRTRDDPYHRPRSPPGYYPSRGDGPWDRRHDGAGERLRRDDRDWDPRQRERSRLDDRYDYPPRRPGGPPYRDYPRSPPRPPRSPSPPPRGSYAVSRMAPDYPPRGRDDRIARRSRSRSPPRRDLSPRYRRATPPRPSYRRHSRSPPSTYTRRRPSPGPSYRPRTPTPPPRRRTPAHTRTSSSGNSEPKPSFHEAKPGTGTPRELPPLRVRDIAAQVKIEPVEVKSEPVDEKMDIDRPAPQRVDPPAASVHREAEETKWRSERPMQEPNQRRVTMPEMRHPAPSQRVQPTAGPSLKREHSGFTADRERSTPRSVKATSPVPVHWPKPEPSPQQITRVPSRSPARSPQRSPALPSPQVGQSVGLPKVTKPIPSGPRSNKPALPKLEPPPKAPQIEIPTRRREWLNTPGYKERELILQKLAAQQRAYQSIAIDVLRTGWDLDMAMVELEGFQGKRITAEKQFERASKGLSLDERLDSPAVGTSSTAATAA